MKGFHNQFDDFFSKDVNKNTWGESGEFYRMTSKSYAKVQQQLETLQIPAGSLVVWDNKLPHATTAKLKGYDSREVIYLSYIPNVPLNIQYWKKQKENFQKNEAPPSYNNGSKVDKSESYELTTFQRFHLL